MKTISKSLKETAEIADNFAKNLESNKKMATIIGFYGELGSGKTTFMKYLAESFGVKEIIQSPTFVIEKIYKTSPPAPLPRPHRLAKHGRQVVKERGQGGEVFKHLIHIDAYRIEKEEEMLNLGWKEIIADPKNLICVEWADRIAKIMPGHIMITFEHVSKTKRKISIA